MNLALNPNRTSIEFIGNVILIRYQPSFQGLSKPFPAPWMAVREITPAWERNCQTWIFHHHIQIKNLKIGINIRGA